MTRYDPYQLRPEQREPFELTGGMPPPEAYPPAPPRPPWDDDGDDEPPYEQYRTNLPVAWRPSRWRWVTRAIAVLIILFVLVVGWLALTAPLSKSLEPPMPPSVTLLSAEGTPIAKRGSTIGAPVDATKLPGHVVNAFVAVEDRRFRQHWGVDPRGIARAAWNNFWAGGVREGGSTITQQLAKNAFLDSDRTAARKLREMLIALWLEAWLSKDEILSRYLSNVYFGDNVYGLSAASEHYFDRTPERLTPAQAAMLAGLVKAPSRLAPTGNLRGARERQKIVVATMVDAGLLTEAEAKRIKPASIVRKREKPLPNGTYFADWVLPQARDRAGEIDNEITVRTTLETRMQRAADRAVRGAGLRKAQVALVAMRPDGRVVAMVGGKNYAASPFNRATQAKRQPGSTFKLFVYLAALRAGMSPDSMVDDSPVTIGGWAPKNSNGRYAGDITLREAFARSSNVAAARLIHKLGPNRVIQVARDLGISTPIANEASIALGTSTVSLLELTAAYAAIANGATPVRPRGLAEPEKDTWLSQLTAGGRPLGRRELEGMRDMLSHAVQNGTGRTAALSIEAFGKTGTTQDSRDVLFVGYAGDLVVGVWVGNDDNTPNSGLSSGIPARIWRDFMIRALGVSLPVAPEREIAVDPLNATIEDLANGFGLDIDLPEPRLEGEISGQGFSLKVGRDGQIEVTGPDEGPPPREPRPEPWERRREPPGE